MKIFTLRNFGYCCIGFSAILFIAGMVTFDSPMEWGDAKIAYFMRDSIMVYVILACFCFIATLLAANSNAYTTAVILALIPTIISFCFSLFGEVCENNSTSWWLMFSSSLWIYPILSIDKKIKQGKKLS